ncbi:hypothetical protein ACM5SQ_005365 [Pseudomonas aeruginosa]
MAKKDVKKRDDFSPATIRKIKEMSGDVCSMPSCRVITGGSKKLRDNSFSIGVAAHICAASPGGPRYDLSMGKEDRKSYENGIWLCQTHSRMIDVDPARFPVDLLKAWKEEAERWSMTNVGQKLISQLDHDNAIRKAVGRSIAEFVGGGDSINAPVQNIILGYEEGLNELDSRFVVKVARKSDGVLVHQIFSRPGEDGRFKLSIKKSENIEDSIRRMVERGEKACFDRDDFEFSGSKLFEEISKGKGGRLHVGVEGKEVELVIYLVLEDGDEEEFANFKSVQVSGTKYGKITGQAFSGLLSVNFEFSLLGDLPNLNINFNPNVWIGQDVSRLGYFSNIKKIVKHLRGGGVRKLATEIVRDKQAYRIGLGNIEDASPFVEAMTWHVDLLNAVRVISDAVFQPIIVKDFNISVEDEETLFRYASLLEGDIVETVKPGHEFCRGVFTPEGFKNYDEMPHKENEFSVRFVEDDGRFFKLLGNEVKPPPVDVSIEKCTVNRFSYIEGDDVGAEGFVVYAIDDTKCVLSLQKSRQWVLDSKD